MPTQVSLQQTDRGLRRSARAQGFETSRKQASKQAREKLIEAVSCPCLCPCSPHSTKLGNGQQPSGKTCAEVKIGTMVLVGAWATSVVRPSSSSGLPGPPGLVGLEALGQGVRLRCGSSSTSRARHGTSGSLAPSSKLWLQPPLRLG